MRLWNNLVWLYWILVNWYYPWILWWNVCPPIKGKWTKSKSRTNCTCSKSHCFSLKICYGKLYYYLKNLVSVRFTGNDSVHFDNPRTTGNTDRQTDHSIFRSEQCSDRNRRNFWQNQNFFGIQIGRCNQAGEGQTILKTMVKKWTNATQKFKETKSAKNLKKMENLVIKWLLYI